MQSPSHEAIWNFDSAISLLQSLSHPPDSSLSLPLSHSPPQKNKHVPHIGSGLGDFTSVWEYLGQPRLAQDDTKAKDVITYKVNGETVAELDAAHLGKGVRWRDEFDGADLEDNVEPIKVSAASLRTQKRAARRARAKQRTDKLASLDGTQIAVVSDTATDGETSDEELQRLRRSPDRRAVIADMLGHSNRNGGTSSPPTSPSPPKVELRTPIKTKDWPISTPFLWQASGVPSPSHRTTIVARDGLTPRQRKSSLISQLMRSFPDEKKYLSNSGLIEPAFTPLNTSKIGIHVFIDMSNISIGFHDCLKLTREIPISTRVRRVPLNFHNFSLVLERGRPAAKRVLVGSDKTPSIAQAKTLGYETNILERVHKAKELTPKQQRYQHRDSRSSGQDHTSGSETPFTSLFQPSKWVEQAVDEILHLKILESLIDFSDKPSTIVLATGDAAEAEYSGGFLRMVERALGKGWMVELVSFRLNTSSLYKRKEFRDRWGPMFRWVVLDDFVEGLLDEPAYEHEAF